MTTPLPHGDARNPESEATLRRLVEERLGNYQAERFRFLGEMASGLVHEFSQPVAGIRGFAEGMLLGKQRGWDVSEEEVCEGLGQIVSLCDRMAQLLDHVRDFAQEPGSPERMEVSLSDVIDSALLLVGARFRGHGVELSVEERDGPLAADANPFLLEEALLALLANALDGCDELAQDDPRERRVDVVTRREAAEGPPRVVLEVIDNGVGIPADRLDRVETPFFTTKGPDRGMGLGLLRARRAAELFGGDFALISEPAKGTTARMRLAAPPPAKEGAS